LRRFSLQNFHLFMSETLLIIQIHGSNLQSIPP
jgi:hypothetical protein